MIPDLSCDFACRGSGRLLDCRAPMLTVADLCGRHGFGTDLSRRQSATTTAPRRTRCAYASLHPHRPQPRPRVPSASPSTASGAAHGLEAADVSDDKADRSPAHGRSIGRGHGYSTAGRAGLRYEPARRAVDRAGQGMSPRGVEDARGFRAAGCG